MIKFPKVHIAESVSNRILNIADGVPMPAPLPHPDPVVPDTRLQGAVLDAQLITPPEPVELPAGSDGAVVDAALNGESLTAPPVQTELGFGV